MKAGDKVIYTGVNYAYGKWKNGQEYTLLRPNAMGGWYNTNDDTWVSEESLRLASQGDPLEDLEAVLVRVRAAGYEVECKTRRVEERTF